MTLQLIEHGAEDGELTCRTRIWRSARDTLRNYVRRYGKAKGRSAPLPDDEDDPVQSEGATPDREMYGRELRPQLVDARSALPTWAQEIVDEWLRGTDEGGGGATVRRPNPKRAKEILEREMNSPWVKIAVLPALGVMWPKSASAGLGVALALLVLLPISVAVAPREILFSGGPRVDPPTVTASSSARPEPLSPPHLHDAAGSSSVTPPSVTAPATATPHVAVRPASRVDDAVARERQERLAEGALYAAMGIAETNPTQARATLRRFDQAAAGIRAPHRAARTYVTFLLKLRERSRAEACRGPGAAVLQCDDSSQFAGAVLQRCARVQP